MNQLSVRYFLTVRVEGTKERVVENLETTHQITILTPEIFPVIKNQMLEAKQTPKKLGIFSQGTCNIKCYLQKDVIYPRDSLQIKAIVDNSKVTRSVESYTMQLMRRVEVISLNKKSIKPLFTRDQIILEETFEANCDKKQTEEKQFDLYIPEAIFPDEEKMLMPTLSSDDKHMQRGPSSSFSGQLFKIIHVVYFQVRHQHKKTSAQVAFPILIMTPNTSKMNPFKYKHKQHPNWQPYEYKNKELYMLPEEESMHPYLKFRYDLIQKELEFTQAKNQRSDTMQWNNPEEVLNAYEEQKGNAYNEYGHE